MSTEAQDSAVPLPGLPPTLLAANREVLEASHRVSQTLTPDLRSVTVHLLQPVPFTSTANPHGRLVDVTDEYPSGTQEFIGQIAETGATGTYVTMSKGQPSRGIITKRISDADVTSYLANPSGTRRRQIAVEAKRHGIELTKNDRPDTNLYLHHCPLQPPTRTLSPARLPVLGTIYSLSRSNHPPRLRIPIDQVAHVLSQHLLKVRIDTLFGTDMIKLAEESADISTPSDRLIRLAAKFTFCHHWFYPYDPVAYAYVRQQLTSADVSRLYNLHGWLDPQPAPPLPKTCLSLSRVVEQLGTDFTEVMSLYAPIAPRIDHSALSGAFSTALFLLAGSLLRLATDRFSSDVILPATSKLLAKWVTCALPVPPGEEVSLHLPTYPLTKICRADRRTRDDVPATSQPTYIAALAPGQCASRFVERQYVKPEHIIKGLKASKDGALTVTFTPVGEKNVDAMRDFPWLGRYARSTVQLLLHLTTQCNSDNPTAVDGSKTTPDTGGQP